MVAYPVASVDPWKLTTTSSVSIWTTTGGNSTLGATYRQVRFQMYVYILCVTCLRYSKYEAGMKNLIRKHTVTHVHAYVQQ